MRNDNGAHLTEDQLLFAVIGDEELDGAGRAHLRDCAACRTEKELLEGRLARLGHLAHELAPVPMRKPSLEPARKKAPVRLHWGLRPSLAMGLIVACLLILVMVPSHYRAIREANLEKVYREMVLDQKLLLEVESLEENPIPLTYLGIPDLPDRDGADESSNRGTQGEPESPVSRGSGTERT